VQQLRQHQLAEFRNSLVQQPLQQLFAQVKWLPLVLVS